MGDRSHYCGRAMGEPMSTPDLLLDAAARLFAERGIDNVSMAEIVRAADQRNTSAVRYHFGSRDDVLAAVLGPPCPGHRRASAPSCSNWLGARTDPIRLAAAEAMVRPVTEFAQRGWRERAYLQIGSEMTGALDRTTPEIRDAAGADRRQRGLGSPPRAMSRGSRRPVASPPRDLHRLHRPSRCGPGPTTRSGSARTTSLPTNASSTNLIDMVLGAMTAPHREILTRMATMASEYAIPATEELDSDVRIAQELGALGRRRPAGHAQLS